MTGNMEHPVTYLSAIAVALLIGSSQCSVIKFEASPGVIKTNLTSFVSMRCSLSDTESHQIGRRGTTDTSVDVTRISSITIRRNNGQEVAFATPFDPPTAMVDLGNLEVKGDVSGASSEGYMELTWRDAVRVALGEYVCDVGTLEAGHRTLVFTASLELTSVTPSVLDLVTEFKMMAQRQKEQEDELAKQKSEISSIKQENSDLLQENKRLNQTVYKLTKCASARVSFMAVLSRGGQNGITYAVNQRVVFDKTITNEGDTYSNQTGKFVCKRSGIYQFNAHATSYGGAGVCLHLNINSASVTSLYAYDTGSYPESGSTSAMVHLEVGDQVDMMTSASCTGGAKFFQNSDVWQDNVFTGHLVHSDECFV